MHISGKFTDTLKADIAPQKADIKERIANIDDAVTEKTREHILKLYGEFGNKNFFGRSDVEKITGLKSTRASELIKLMLDNNVIEPVIGHGKGKHCFKQ